MKRISAIVFHAFFTLYLNAQIDEGKKYSVQGTVIDEKGKLIPYSNILLYNVVDSSQVSATASDEKGKFGFSVAPGSYFLKISFLSYEEKIVQDISISDKDVNIGS